MEAGRLRETIVISSPTSGRDADGYAVTTWATFLTTRAAFNPLIGREYFAANETQSLVEVKFNLRYHAGVQNNFRVAHKGVDYDILSAVNVEGRNRELVLYCKKVTR